MIKKILNLIVMLFLIIMLLWCSAGKSESKKNAAQKYQSIETVTNNDKMQITSKQYSKDGIVAEYPVIVSGGSKEQMKKWNQLIEKDFNKILDIYSFNPFPELTPIPTDRIPTILKIKYEIKLNNDHYLSILYNASYNSPYSAHPTDLVYTTNINKMTGTRMKLSDIVKIDQKFVNDFRSWDFIPIEKGNAELNKAITDYVNGLSDGDLLMGFQSSDNIGSGNIWGIYSYLMPDRLGISLGVPNYIGDHVEFERDYLKLKDFLKKDTNIALLPK